MDATKYTIKKEQTELTEITPIDIEPSVPEIEPQPQPRPIPRSYQRSGELTDEIDRIYELRREEFNSSIVDTSLKQGERNKVIGLNNNIQEQYLNEAVNLYDVDKLINLSLIEFINFFDKNNLRVFYKNGYINIKNYIGDKERHSLNKKHPRTGESSTFIFSDSNYNSIYSITSVILKNDIINIKIIDHKEDKEPLNLELNSDEDIKNNNLFSNQYNSFNTDIDLNSLNITFMSLWVSINNIYKSKNEQEDNSNSKEKRDVVLQEENECEPEKTSNGWTNFKFPVSKACLQPKRVYVPCGGTHFVNISECCRELAKDRWCSQNVFELINADLKYFGCVKSKIYNAITYGHGWLCDIINVAWYTATVAVEIAVYILTLIELVELFKEGRKEDGENVDIGDNEEKEFIEDLRKYYKTIRTIKDLVSFYAGFEFDSRNEDSCLCDGNQPTYCCNPKEDPKYCYEYDDQGNLILDEEGNPKLRNLCPPKKSECYPCHWAYKENIKTGKLEKRWITDPTGELPCCEPRHKKELGSKFRSRYG